MRWVVVKGPREFDQLDGFEMDVGWLYEIAGSGVRRPVSVIVEDGALQSPELPHEARRAVTTHVWSAVHAVLDRSGRRST